MTCAPIEKPRALFIRHKRIKNSAEFLNNVEDESVRTLSLHTHLTVIDQDFDYSEVCDKLNPDFVIVDSPGGNRPLPLNVTNITARQDIPRIGFTVQDPHDTARVTFLRLMDDWQVDRFFNSCVATLKHCPEIADRGFIAPLYINPAVFNDYGLEKTIPLSIFGGVLSPDFYAWRGQTASFIHQIIPTLLYTHPGYDPVIPAHRYPVSGVAYAKMINRSYFSLADTTRLDYVVRKHFEIPASGTVLIAPDTPDMGYHGFVDMQNCILGEREALVEKITRVAADPDLYESIRKQGHDLVHSRYTADKWTGIVEWFRCTKALKPGEAVQQQGVLGPFAAVPATPGLPAMKATLPDNEFAAKMKRARNNLLRGENLNEVFDEMQRIMQWVGHIGEPWLFLGIHFLQRGDLAQARRMFLAAHAIRFQRDHATYFDPEEIAWLSFTATLLGDQELLARIIGDMKNLRHISIRRMLLLANVMAGKMTILNLSADILSRQPGDHHSTHWMGDVSWADWITMIKRILQANGITLHVA